MNWRLSGLDQAILFHFMVDGQFVQPDSASIRLTVRGNDGAVLPDYNGIAQPDVTSTQVLVTLPAASNTLPADTLFESRFARLDFTVNSEPFCAEFNYKLYSFVPMTADNNKVRGLVGATHDELPNDDIDLLGAFFTLLVEHGDNIKTALTRADISNLAANEAIALRAALDTFPSLQARLLKNEKQDNAGYTRHDVDFKRLEADLNTRLTEKIELINQTLTTVTTVVATPVLFTVTKQTDPLTNA